jgi:molybdopterin synthase catalytic subunit
MLKIYILMQSLCFSFTQEEINIAYHINKVNDTSCGGVSMFLGTVRDNFQGRKVLYLDYTAYEKMARKEVDKIMEEAVISWPKLKHISIEHRLGQVQAGKASVIIICSSSDRQSCQQAVNYIIEGLKSRVTIWKKEFGEDWAEWKANLEWNPDSFLKN